MNTASSLPRWRACLVLTALMLAPVLAACGEEETQNDKLDVSQDTAQTDTSAPDTTPTDTSTTQEDTDNDTSGVTQEDTTPDAEDIPDIEDTPDTEDTADDAEDTADTEDTSDAEDAADMGDTSGGTPTPCPAPPSDLPTLTMSQSGRFVTVSAFPGDGLMDRDLTVYLPADYDAQPDARYPVLYMHDGQNLFHDGDAPFGVAWEVDDTLDTLVSTGAVRPFIVVGIHNTDARLSDYTPSFDPTEGGGNAAAYMTLVADRIKPYVDANFRTICGPENTALAGSSLGGLVSFHQMMATPEVFGRVAAVSPSFWWNNGEALSTFDQYSGPLPARLWIDSGTAEGGPVEAGMMSVTANSRAAVAIAQTHGMTLGDDLAYMEHVWAQHNEDAWSQRLPSILTYLLTDNPVTARTPTDLWIHVHRPAIKTTAPDDLTAVAVNTLYDNAIWLTTFADDPDLAVEPAATVVSVNADGHLLAQSEGTSRLLATKGALTAGAAVLVNDDQDPLNVTVVFTASTPAGTQGPVYITGSVPSLGEWIEPGVEMIPLGGGYWAYPVALPADTVVEYKYTLGSWATVEKGPNGEELTNRTWLADAPAVIRDAIASWAP